MYKNSVVKRDNFQFAGRPILCTFHCRWRQFD